MLELLESQGKIISKPLDFHCMCGCTLLLVGGGTCWHLAFREEILARSYHPKKRLWKPEIRLQTWVSIRSPSLLCSSWHLPRARGPKRITCEWSDSSSQQWRPSLQHSWSSNLSILFLHHPLVGVYCDVLVSCLGAFYMGVCRWNLSAFANPGTYSKPRCFEWQWLPCRLVEASGRPCQANHVSVSAADNIWVCPCWLSWC